MKRVIVLLCVLNTATALADPPDGFTSMFNGKDLTGWDGSPTYWKVDNGILTGTADGTLKYNRFIVWRGGKVKNFEWLAKVRVTPGGNSGLQYRSVERPDLGESVVVGYQCDVVPDRADYNGMLYEERGRRILAHTGEKVIIDAEGQPWVVDKMEVKEFKAGAWHDFRVLVEGNHHRHWIDGHLTVDVIDLDEKGRKLEGILGMQVHVGPKMTIEFKDLYLKKLADNLPVIEPAQARIPTSAVKVVPQGKDNKKKSPNPDVKGTINRGLAFLVKDNVAWRESRKCFECHHAPFSIWALNEAKHQGYAVDEKALAELTSWVLGKDYLAQLIVQRPAQTPAAFNEAPMLLALAIEAGDTRATQDGLKKLLASVLSDQSKEGFWKRDKEARPILSSPDTLTTLAVLALSAPNAPDMGQDGKAAQAKALKWLETVKQDDELQSAALRLILWRQLGRPASEWQPLVERLRMAQHDDGGWSQLKDAKSDAYATGQALYALAGTGMKLDDKALSRAQSFLAKTQREDGGWSMSSRALMANGKVATKFEPITHAASAWAVMGLVRSAPVTFEGDTRKVP